MMGAMASPAASSSPPASEPREAPAPLETLKQKVREALGAREQLAGRVELVLARLRAEVAELEAALGAPEGDAAVLEEVRKLRDRVAMEIEEREKTLEEVKKGAVEGLVNGEEETNIGGKRSREEEEGEVVEEQQEQLAADRGDVDEVPIQLAELGFAANSLNVGGEDCEARTLAAGVRIAIRYAARTGQLIPETMLRAAFEMYTSKPLDTESCQRVLAVFSNLGYEANASGDAERDQIEGRSAMWVPAAKYLENPSLSLPASIVPQNDKSIEARAAVVQAFIEAEKQVLAQLQQSMRDGVANRENSDSLRALCTQAAFTSLAGSSEANPPEAYAFLASRFNYRTGRPRNMAYRTFREFAGLFLEKQNFLLCLAESPGILPTQLHAGTNTNSASTDSTAYAKPFSLKNDSILRQLVSFTSNSGSGLRQSKRQRKADPMKTMCPYELHGICKDTNCAHLHSRDFSFETLHSHEPKNKNLELSTDQKAFIADFTAVRTKYLGKWPLIVPDPTASMETSEKPNAVSKQSNDHNALDNRGVVSLEIDEATAEVNNADFVALDEVEQVDGLARTSASQRYYDQDIDQEPLLDDISQLEQIVQDHPEECNAWIELAIRQLDLDISLSDEIAQATGQSRVRKELVALSKVIDSKQLTRSASDTIKLRKCLHILSRALEFEANCEREELWLLYLHMCREIGDRQLEAEIAVKAVQFVSNSGRLWLFYLSRYDDSVPKAVDIHGRVVRLLVEESDTFPEANSSWVVSTASRSEMLAAVTLSLCLSLVAAEAFDELHQLLELIVCGEDNKNKKTYPAALQWCVELRPHLSAIETAAFQLIYAHVLVFNRLPKHAEAWVTQVGAKSMQLGRFAYTIESFRQDLAESRGGVLPSDLRAKVLTVYEHAHSFVSSETLDTSEPGGEVVLNNWMILVGELYLQDTEDTVEIEKFFSNQMSVIQAFPSSAFTASKLLTYHLEDPDRAVQLMLDMLSNCAEEHFPISLHYYLCSSLYLPDLTVGLDLRFSDVMSILASNLGADPGEVKAAIRRIKMHQDPVAKSKELEDLLFSLLSLWMGELAAATNNLPNIYSAIALCHLMTRLCQPSVGISGLERILRSSNFWKLDADARNLAWVFRFYLQIVHLERESNYGQSNMWYSAELPDLASLYKRYMVEMGESAELRRQRERLICSGGEFSEAIIECLYPRRHVLLTTEVQMELFQLCQMTVSDRQKPRFFAYFAEELASDPRFSLWFSDLAGGWEWRAARDCLKRALIVNIATPWHAPLVRAIVLGDIKRRRMKAASNILKLGLSVNSFSQAVWKLAIGLEIVLGEPSAVRSATISQEIGKLGLPFVCNMYGDASVLKYDGILLNSPSEQVDMLSWQALRLPVVPRSVLLHSEIVHLDLSGNYLVELPSDLNQLKCLKTLNVAENALLQLPDTLTELSNLETLIVAHNNLKVLPIESWDKLSKLKIIDSRFNMLQSVSVNAVETLTGLEMVELDGNLIPESELIAVHDVLRNRRAIEIETSSTPLEEISNCVTQPENPIEVYKPSESDEPVSVERMLSKPSHPIDLTNEGDSDHSVSHSTSGASNGGFVPFSNQSQSVIDLANEVMGVNDKDNGESELMAMEILPAAVIEADGSGGAVVTNDPGTDAWNKMKAYMASNDIQARRRVREENPQLWGEFVDANVTIHRSLGPCILCDAPNSHGLHQRLNALTMCWGCIGDLKARLHSSM